MSRNPFATRPLDKGSNTAARLLTKREMPPRISRRKLVLASGGLLAGTSGCLGGQTEPTKEEEEEEEEDRVLAGDVDTVVMMTNDWSFNPETVEIETGQTVLWENQSQKLQSVTAYERRIPDDADYFASGGFGTEMMASIVFPIRGGLNQGETFAHTFDVPGTYEYYSIPSKRHGMIGTIIVL